MKKCFKNYRKDFKNVLTIAGNAEKKCLKVVSALRAENTEKVMLKKFRRFAANCLKILF